MNRTATSSMTRERTWVLTAVSVLLFILLCGIFADDLFAPPLWNSEEWISSPLITYLLILAIVLAGWSQARSLPTAGFGSADAGPGAPGRSTTRRLAPADGQYLLRTRLAADALLPGPRLVIPWRGKDRRSSLDERWGSPARILGTGHRDSREGRPPIAYDWFRHFLQYMLDNGWYDWFAKLGAWRGCWSGWHRLSARWLASRPSSAPS